MNVRGLLQYFSRLVVAHEEVDTVTCQRSISIELQTEGFWFTSLSTHTRRNKVPIDRRASIGAYARQTKGCGREHAQTFFDDGTQVRQ